jgi:hypothetical protein
MEKEIPPPSDYPHSLEDWEDGLGRCERCDGSRIELNSAEKIACKSCNGSGQTQPFLPPDEQLPEINSSREPGTADWWKEQMRSHLSGVYEATGHKRPNAAANQVIRVLERIAKQP